MAKVYEFLANGFEEIEGLAPVDILRRGGVDIKTVSITGSEWVETSHGVTIKADLKFEDIQSLTMPICCFSLVECQAAAILMNMKAFARLSSHSTRQANESVPSAQPLWFWQAQAFSKARKQPAILASNSISARIQNIQLLSSRRMAM